MTFPSSARVLALADSDSYLKWAAGLLDTLPSQWQHRLALVRSPILPSTDQITAATAGTSSARGRIDVLTPRGLRALVEATRPDAVMAMCTGPVVDVIIREILVDIHPRPIFVSGLPGISVPATMKAWRYRSPVDLFVIHSRQELRDFSELGMTLGVPGQVGLARLPYLPRGVTPAGDGAGRNTIVFASQAKVPVRKRDREQILRSLAELSISHPELRPIVKLRARQNEEQTHRERHHFEDLWNAMVGRNEVPTGAVSFETGAMADHLATAAGFVTVSSTAALEAIAMSVPLLIVSDFGVNAQMINTVFEGSGCLGTLEELQSARFKHPSDNWLDNNYFHAEAENDWVEKLALLVEKSRAFELGPVTSLIDGPAHLPGRRRASRRLRLHPFVLKVRNELGRRAWRMGFRWGDEGIGFIYQRRC